MAVKGDLASMREEREGISAQIDQLRVRQKELSVQIREAEEQGVRKPGSLSFGVKPAKG